MNLVEKITNDIREQFEKDSSGHDWFHIMRVLNTARYIQSKEGGNLEVIELAALLHDISDHKFNGGKLDEGGKVAKQILERHTNNVELINQVTSIIDQVSFKGANTTNSMQSLEGQIVQDADRLDAIGAIGVARTFAYGGHKGQAMYIPELEPVMHDSFEEYAKAETSSINHFYEKLLLLADRLNTSTAKQLGKDRHQYMEGFLNTFLDEWNFNA